MKKKFVILFLSIACTLCLAFAFAGCIDGENGESSNSGSNTQQGNEGDKGSDSGGHVHNYGNLIPEKSATCTEEGLQAHYYCSGCQKYFDSEKQEKTHDELKIAPQDHNYGELVPEQHATCTEEGMQAYYHCAVCNKYFNSGKVETAYNNLKIGVDYSAHKWGADGKCEYCKKQKPVYMKSEDGTKIYFGEYPQSEVTESGLKTTLSWEAGNGTLPTAGNANGWTDYNYYVSGEIQSYMWYKDVEYQNNRYRGVYFSSYRPEQTTDAIYESLFGNGSRQDDNGYYINTEYWFKYEPIEWRILEQKDGAALLMSNIILDSQQFYHSRNERTKNGTIYANNYKESDIRIWLNDTFYNTAFNEFSQSIIQITEVQNGADTTSNPDNNNVCDNTSDRIFLLSYMDIINSEYGFNSDGTENDEARQIKNTAYALAQGYNTSNASGTNGWWLRSPRSGNGITAQIVKYNGVAAYSSGECEYEGVRYTSEGVVPALWIKL